MGLAQRCLESPESDCILMVITKYDVWLDILSNRVKTL